MGEGDTTGGSRELAQLIDEYGEFLLPDLKQYGIDLRDLFLEEPPFSPRYVLAHIHNLDYHSAFVAEVRGGQRFRGWDEDRYLAASLTNALRTLIYIFILANSDPKKRKQKPPEMWPLPDEIKKQDNPGSFAFIARSHIAAIRKRKALTRGSR